MFVAMNIVLNKQVPILTPRITGSMSHHDTGDGKTGTAITNILN